MENMNVVKISRRRKILAVVFSLLLPGFGHFILGLKKRGILCSVFCAVGGIVFLMVAVHLYPHLTLIFALLLSIAWLYNPIDALKRASAELSLKRPGVLLCLVYLAAFSVIAETINKYKPGKFYVMHSSSMGPALMNGDYVYAEGIADTNELQMGDIIVFKNPQEPTKSYTFRLIAKANSTVEVKDEKVLVDGKEILLEPLTNNAAPVKRFKARLENGREFIIEYKSDSDPEQGFEKAEVQANHFFVLGDVRNNAMDSRYIGFIPSANVLGRVRAIAYSFEGNILSPRFSRIGKLD